MLIENNDKIVIGSNKRRWIRVDARKYNVLIKSLRSERDNNCYPVATIFSLSFTQKRLSLSFAHEKKLSLPTFSIAAIVFCKKVFPLSFL